MKVFIVRHAQAVIGENNDANRALDAIGQQQAQKLAHWLSKQIQGDIQLVSSPYLRTKQTASAIAKALNCEIKELSSLIPSSITNGALDALADYTQDVIVVSHQPLVGCLASQLVDGNNSEQPWATAECRVLEGDMAARDCMQIKTLWYPS